jgi:hypothetical protein
MTSKYWLIGAVGAVALCFAAAPSQAAPNVGVTSGLAAIASQDSAVSDVRWRRRCWWHRGHWHCRRHVRRWYPDYYYGGYVPRRHYRYRPGFAVYGPGFGLYVGPRHRRYGW